MKNTIFFASSQSDMLLTNADVILADNSTLNTTDARGHQHESSLLKSQ